MSDDDEKQSPITSGSGGNKTGKCVYDCSVCVLCSSAKEAHWWSFESYGNRFLLRYFFRRSQYYSSCCDA